MTSLFIKRAKIKPGNSVIYIYNCVKSHEELRNFDFTKTFTTGSNFLKNIFQLLLIPLLFALCRHLPRRTWARLVVRLWRWLVFNFFIIVNCIFPGLISILNDFGTCKNRPKSRAEKEAIAEAWVVCVLSSASSYLVSNLHILALRLLRPSPPSLGGRRLEARKFLDPRFQLIRITQRKLSQLEKGYEEWQLKQSAVSTHTAWLGGKGSLCRQLIAQNQQHLLRGNFQPLLSTLGPGPKTCSITKIFSRRANKSSNHRFLLVLHFSCLSAVFSIHNQISTRTLGLSFDDTKKLVLVDIDFKIIDFCLSK